MFGGVSEFLLNLFRCTKTCPQKKTCVFFGSLYGLSGGQLESRTKWCLSFAGLEDRKNDRVKTFSGGMKRRLNIAAAMIHEPDILLLDEPTVGVDPQSRNHIFESIESLKSGGLTLIYTTHYMEEAQRLCDRVAVIDQGKLLALDTVDALIERHGGSSSVTMTVANPVGFSDMRSGLFDQFSVENNEIRFVSDKPFEAIAELSSSHGTQIQSLQLARSDLEGVFLNLTGRSLRD